MRDEPQQSPQQSLPSREEVRQLIELLRGLQNTPADIADIKKRLGTVQDSLSDIYRTVSYNK